MNEIDNSWVQDSWINYFIEQNHKDVDFFSAGGKPVY